MKVLIQNPMNKKKSENVLFIFCGIVVFYDSLEGSHC